MVSIHSPRLSQHFFQVCQLQRFGETSGLGISLEARAGHHYLCSILPEGPLGQSGKIFLGDQILEVNNRYRSLTSIPLMWDHVKFWNMISAGLNISSTEKLT